MAAIEAFMAADTGAFVKNLNHALSIPDIHFLFYIPKVIKERFKKPTITTGNIRSPKVVEELLEDSAADFIGIGRGLIADPNWVNKVQFGQEETIRKCISCNIGCAGHRLSLNRPIRCTVNPNVNEWDTYKSQKVVNPCNVVVVGSEADGCERCEYDFEGFA